MKKPRWLHRLIVENLRRVCAQVAEAGARGEKGPNSPRSRTQATEPEGNLLVGSSTRDTPSDSKGYPEARQRPCRPPPGFPDKSLTGNQGVTARSPSRSGGEAEGPSRHSSGPTGPRWGVEPKGDRVWGVDPRDEGASPAWSTPVRGLLDSGKWKTKLCTLFYRGKGCKYGEWCAFAHGIDELLPLALGALSESTTTVPAGVRASAAPTASPEAARRAPTVGPTSTGSQEGRVPAKGEWPNRKAICARYWKEGWCNIPSCPFGHGVTCSAARGGPRRARASQRPAWSDWALARDRGAKGRIICPTYWQDGYCGIARCPFGHGLTRRPSGRLSSATMVTRTKPQPPPTLRRWRRREDLAQQAAAAWGRRGDRAPQAAVVKTDIEARGPVARCPAGAEWDGKEGPPDLYSLHPNEAHSPAAQPTAVSWGQHEEELNATIYAEELRSPSSSLSPVFFRPERPKTLYLHGPDAPRRRAGGRHPGAWRSPSP